MSYFLGRLGTILAKLGRFQLGVGLLGAQPVETIVFIAPACDVTFAPPVSTVTFIAPPCDVIFAPPT